MTEKIKAQAGQNTENHKNLLKTIFENKPILLAYVILISLLFFNIFSVTNTFYISDKPSIGCDGVLITYLDDGLEVIHKPENNSNLAKVRFYEENKF